MTDIYIFATNTQNALISYPNDQTFEYFQYVIKMSKNNVQIVLVRKDNLLHYCYVRRIGNKQVFGLCLRLDRIYSDIEDLFRAFDAAFSNLVESGAILQMDSTSNIKLGVSNFAAETVAIKEMSDNLIQAIGISQRNTLPLPPADYSVSINDCKEVCLEDTTNVQIINAIKKYSNVYIVKTHAEIARITEFINLVKKKNEEITRLQMTIVGQNDTISKLKKQKNKYKWVVFLLFVLFVGVVLFAFYAQNRTQIIQDMTDEIEILNNTIDIKNTYINQLKQDSTTLSTEKHQWINKYNTLSKQYEDIKDYSKKIPLIISRIEIANTDYNRNILTDFGKKIYSNSTRYFTPKIYYTSVEPTMVVLKTKWYNTDRQLSRGDSSPIGFSQSENYYISSGQDNELRLRGWGNNTSGHWKAGKYSVEIWYNDICLGVKHFEVY